MEPHVAGNALETNKRRANPYHVIGFYDLVDLWVIKIKKPMILCALSTSRSREQSAKLRPHRESMRKVCLL